MARFLFQCRILLPAKTPPEFLDFVTELFLRKRLKALEIHSSLSKVHFALDRELPVTPDLFSRYFTVRGEPKLDSLSSELSNQLVSQASVYGGKWEALARECTVQYALDQHSPLTKLPEYIINAIRSLIRKPEGMENPLEQEAEVLRTIRRSSFNLGSDIDFESPSASIVDAALEQGPRGDHERMVLLGRIAFWIGQAEYTKDALGRSVEEAHDAGIGWSAIGRAAGISPQSAHRRWDTSARQKHSDYRRNRDTRPSS